MCDKKNDWMTEARETAASCWCDKETSGIEMDSRLAEAFARRLAAWMDTAAHESSGRDYYRGLLYRCGVSLGEPAHLCDDGTRSEDVLRAKVPELVRDLVMERDVLRELVRDASNVIRETHEYLDECGPLLADEDPESGVHEVKSRLAKWLLKSKEVK